MEEFKEVTLKQEMLCHMAFTTEHAMKYKTTSLFYFIDTPKGQEFKDIPSLLASKNLKLKLNNMEELFKKVLETVDEQIDKPLVSARFGDNWKTCQAVIISDRDSLINIAWRQGRRAILLERVIGKLLREHSVQPLPAKELSRERIIEAIKSKNIEYKGGRFVLSDNWINSIADEILSSLPGAKQGNQTSLKERIIKNIKEGYNIEAIRLYKTEMNCDLREAKYQVSLIRKEVEERLPEAKPSDEQIENYVLSNYPIMMLGQGEDQIDANEHFRECLIKELKALRDGKIK